MNKITIAALCAFCALASSIFTRLYYAAPKYASITNAVAVIHPTKANTAAGIITFSQEDSGVQITARITGLAQGEHGFHIHEFGDCGCDDAVCAGSHFNPTNEPHAGPDTQHRHAGDLGNITANQEGVAEYQYLDKKIQLNGPRSIIGRTVIIHTDADDLISQPTGNAGARVGCGVIGIAQKKQ